MAERQLRTVRLLEPEICLDCPFAKIADVETAGGNTARMIYCKRLDCDNWDRDDSELVTRITLQDT